MKMTPQEIFDKSYLGLKAQGQRSTGPNGGCAYNGDGGLRCGVGIIFDAPLSPEIEGWDITSAWSLHRDKFPAWVKDNLDLLGAIQYAHDHSEDWGDAECGFEANFADVSRRFFLVMPEAAS